MSYGFRVDVRGDYALFSRPEMKVERVSYDCITPSAARGVLEAIFWHPGMQYKIDRIYVLNPIKFDNIRRNEVKAKISAANVLKVANQGRGELYLATTENIQQRASMVLRDVHYVIDAHFVMTEKANATDNTAKFHEMFQRRLKKGQCYHMPYLGCREFPAEVRPFEGEMIQTAYPNEEKDLGFMLYDMDYSNPEDIRPMFFRAVLKNGVLDVAKPEVYA
ncbi:type I-C CRISPR-associated protein Cas5c [Selenomonas ruminantium]|uniref:type I-C CRISPR-associated protein Cas5c n=1 Tax=Selenomonas ruminantium TaxID=971 RepID=UPI0026E961F1|nr:type I-C CRISPR-associated protein Cas5c [Selenomonas ruminantium]